MILVTGGAGYIGSHTVLALREQKRRVLVLDDLSEGHEAALLGAQLVRGSTLDTEFLARVFDEHEITAVCHFAARCYVGESTRQPELYYRNNVVGTLNLLEAMHQAGVHRIVFSSTCATYGIPNEIPISETAPQEPINPYGSTKLVCEGILRDMHSAHGMDSVSLRYFNAAGADPQGRLGEHHDPETHLIPLVLSSIDTTEPIKVFGDDYPTPDGTCVRDYVHVVDIAEAHILALKALEDGRHGAMAFNLGSEHGASVLEIIETAQRVTGKTIPYEIAERRAGDPAFLVGNADLIRGELGWVPRFSDTKVIVETAWQWQRTNPEGFPE